MRILLILAGVFASSLTYGGIQAELDKIVAKYQIPSMSVMMLKGNKTTVHTYQGVRRIGGKVQITENDSFHLGSCGKAFTSTLVLKLMDEGKLSIEDPISKYLPSLNIEKFGDIKIKNLMSHTAGIDANVQGDLWLKMFSFDISPVQGRDLALNYISKAKRQAKAGEKFLYSNIGYMLLGKIIETVEKSPYEKVLKQKLFTPLGMKTCSYGPVGRNAGSSGPWPHQLRDGKLIAIDPSGIYADNPPAMAPAGGISCNQKDWAKFLSYIIGSSPIKILSKKSLQILQTVDLDGYTYGAWGKLKRDWSGTLLSHSGSNTMNYAYVILGLDKKFAFLINTNSPSQDAALEMAKVLKEEFVKRDIN